LAASKNLTPDERTLRARLAAHARWSQEDPTGNAKPAQAGLLDRFRREIVAEQGEVAEPELTRRAEARRREHMARIAFKRSRTRKGGDDAAA
jgi:hypothetical protein